MKSVDFTRGIRAEAINENFSSLSGQLQRERIYLAGAGVVSGFGIEKKNDAPHQIVLGEGTLINQIGKEIKKDETTLSLQPPVPRHIKETISLDENGEAEISKTPFNPVKNIYWNYEDYDNNHLEVNIKVAEEGHPDHKGRLSGLLKTDTGANIALPKSVWANKSISIEYDYAESRVDLIIIDMEDEYRIIHGIDSSSPSKVNPNDYADFYLIGIVEVIPGYNKTELIIYDRKRYRNIYTTENNEIIIHGDNYLEIISHIKNNMTHIGDTPPENPPENKFWYDTLNNKLKVWRKVDKIYDWAKVNDTTIYPIREIKQWRPGDLPKDLQTFYFEDDLPGELQRLTYPPDTNALQVTIDNVPLMHDQFQEIVHPEAGVGIGFKLNAPLDDSKSHIEVGVTHRATEGNFDYVYQRAATFSSEDSFIYSEELYGDRIFEINEGAYNANENQLEVYLNGKKLVHRKDFFEYDIEKKIIPEDRKLINGFLISDEIELNDFDIIQYRCYANIFSYDHFGDIFDEIEENTNEALKIANETEERFNKFEQDISQELELKYEALNNKIAQLESKLEHYVKKDEIISLDQIPERITGKIPGDIIIKEIPANKATIKIDGIFKKDFLTVYWGENNGNESKLLLKEKDYEIEEVEYKGIELFLDSAYISASYSIRIVSIEIGVF